MRVLLDTHILLWTMLLPRKLPKEVRLLIEDRSNMVLFSSVSIWEIAIKTALRRSDFDADPNAVLSEALASGLQELPLLGTVAAQVSRLPLLHSDPFDRVLVAQAMAEPAELLTADAQLEPYSPLVRRI